MKGRDEEYAFTLKGAGIDFAGRVNQARARSMLDIAIGVKPAPIGKAEAEKPGYSLPSESPREFLNSSGAKRLPEKIVAIGEFLSARGEADFSKDEVLREFRLAREAMPGNFSRDLRWAIATGWIAQDSEDPKRFYVTQSGKDALEAKFSGETTKNSGFRSLRRKRRRG